MRGEGRPAASRCCSEVDDLSHDGGILDRRNDQRDARLRNAGSVNYLKPKVFFGRTSIHPSRAAQKKYVAACAVANAEFACAKGRGGNCLPFRQTLLRCAARAGVPLN